MTSFYEYMGMIKSREGLFISKYVEKINFRKRVIDSANGRGGGGGEKLYFI